MRPLPRPGSRLRRALPALLLCLLPALASAQPLLPAERVSTDSLDAFRPTTGNWKVAGGLAGNPRRDATLTAAEGTGVLVCNPAKGQKSHLLTTWEHGDLELDLEFLLAPGANSGVYLQGRYEVQLFDSWRVREPKFSDCGGIYQRWDAARGVGKEGFEGVAPRANAARAPGLWQRLHVEFEAPRFDAEGRKVRPARFTKVVLNDFLIHENVEVGGPTRSAAFEQTEAALGPLMIQGDHGSVAIRRLAVRRAAGDGLTTADLRFRQYDGDIKGVSDIDGAKVTEEGPAAQLGAGILDRQGKFARVFTGNLIVPRDGEYAFSVAASNGLVRLTIGGQPAITPLDSRSATPGRLTLTRGSHPFRLDYVQTSGGRPNLELVAGGPGILRQVLVAGNRPPARGNNRSKEVAVEPADRVLLQRSFVPYEPRKRLYAASVGSPTGVHYAYDFETGALLRAWRGRFLDANQMWEGRGEAQTARPLGAALTLNAKPAFVLLESGPSGDWPSEPEPLWSSKGYTLEADGQPVFLAQLAEMSIRDRIAPAPEGRGLTRTFEVKGNTASWSAWAFLAEADVITSQPDGSWIIGDREWYLDWPAETKVRPVLRTSNGRMQLAVPLNRGNLEKTITYTLVW